MSVLFLYKCLTNIEKIRDNFEDEDIFIIFSKRLYFDNREISLELKYIARKKIVSVKIVDSEFPNVSYVLEGVFERDIQAIYQKIKKEISKIFQKNFELNEIHL